MGLAPITLGPRQFTTQLGGDTTPAPPFIEIVCCVRNTGVCSRDGTKFSTPQ